MSGQWIEVGALLRGGVRRELAKSGIAYRETKGFLESVFVLDCSPAQWAAIAEWVDRVNDTDVTQ